MSVVHIDGKWVKVTDDGEILDRIAAVKVEVKDGEVEITPVTHKEMYLPPDELFRDPPALTRPVEDTPVNEIYSRLGRPDRQPGKKRPQDQTNEEWLEDYNRAEQL